MRCLGSVLLQILCHSGCRRGSVFAYTMPVPGIWIMLMSPCTFMPALERREHRMSTAVRTTSELRTHRSLNTPQLGIPSVYLEILLKDFLDSNHLPLNSEPGRNHDACNLSRFRIAPAPCACRPSPKGARLIARRELRGNVLGSCARLDGLPINNLSLGVGF